jgi:hypothetical protein
MPDRDPHDAARARRYFWYGFLVAGILGMGVVMPGFFTSAWLDWSIVVAIAAMFGYASARWGDAAWIWLSDRVRLLWWW